MITSVFKKSRPINYIIVFIMLVFSFINAIVNYQKATFFETNFLKLSFNFLLVCASLFVITFIVKKNALVKNNNLTGLFFALFILLVPQVFFNTTLLIAHLLVLLAARRIISLFTQRNIINKVLRTGLLLACACLFFSWTFAYVLMAIIAILNLQEKRGKFIVILTLGILSVIILVYTTNLYVPNFIQFNLSRFQYQLNFSAYHTFQLFSAMLLLIILGVWTSFNYINLIAKQKRILKPVFKLMILFFIISFFIVFITKDKSGSEFIFLIAPFSIICANYFQLNKDNWLKEIIFGIWILLIILSLFL